MRQLFIISLIMLGILGCVGLGGPEDNITENVTPPAENITNVTPLIPVEPPKWKTYNTTSFGFEYPIEMSIQRTNNILSSTREIDGQTAEVFIVVFLNTSDVYGVNKDKIFKENPSLAASDLLLEDLKDDSAGVLNNAYDIGSISTYAIVRDVFVAEVPFKIKFNENGKTYTGYALSLYVPERSLHIKVRAIALNPDIAEEIKNRFHLSFRLV